MKMNIIETAAKSFRGAPKEKPMNARLKVTVLIMMIAVIGLAGLFGCAKEGESSEAKSSSAPALQPANHMGRFESLGANGCYGCHGNGELANPNLTKATVMPQFHYVDGSYDSKQYDPGYAQCISCHPVAEKSNAE